MCTFFFGVIQSTTIQEQLLKSALYLHVLTKPTYIAVYADYSLLHDLFATSHYNPQAYTGTMLEP